MASYVCNFLKTCRSESPSQVFIFTLYWLFEILSQLPTEKWGDIMLSYDNMCSLDSLKVAQKPLPLQTPYDEMWLSIQKVCILCVIHVHRCTYMYVCMYATYTYYSYTFIHLHVAWSLMNVKYINLNCVFRWLTHFISVTTKTQDAKKSTIQTKPMMLMKTSILCVQNRPLFGFQGIKE